MTEGIETALMFANFFWRSGSPRSGHARFDFPARRAHTRLEPHHHEYEAQRLRSRRVLAQVPCRNVELDGVLS